MIALQQAGNVKYIGWLLQVPCSKNTDIIKSLKDYAKVMEHELEMWKDKVKTTRLKFYELNYYTTLQLLILRKEFGASSVSSNSVTLLQSISSQISSKMVCDVIKFTPQCTSMSPVHSEETHAAVKMSDFNESVTSGDLLSSSSESSEDESTLTEDNLTVEDQATLVYLTSILECSKSLALQAIKKGMTREECTTWCVENVSKYSDSKDSDEESDGDSELESECDDEVPDQDRSSSLASGNYRNRINFRWGFIFFFSVVDQNPRK